MKPKPLGVMDTSTTDYVECVGCHKRFLGRDLADRMHRWHEHVAETNCKADIDLDPSLAQYLA